MLMLGCDLPLTLHWGDIGAVSAAFDGMTTKFIPRMLAEPNRVAEGILPMFIGTVMWPYLLGRGEQMEAVIAECVGSSWTAIEATCDAFTGGTAGTPPNPVNVYFVPRGKSSTRSGFFSMDICCWCAKFQLALCSGNAVSKQEVMRSLPTPQQLAGYSCNNVPGIDYQSAEIYGPMHPHLCAAMVCEKYGMDDEALTFLVNVYELDSNRGGETRPTSHILGHCVKGRVMARRGQLKAAAAAFEEAFEQAEKYGLWLLSVFALRDLKLCVLDVDGHDKHASARLGVALRRLIGPASSLTPLLQGLDAGELMALDPPDSSYEVALSEANGAQLNLRAELEGLRLKELRQRARGSGVDDEAVEDALDEDDPKAALVEILMLRADPAPKPAPKPKQVRPTVRARSKAAPKAAISSPRRPVKAKVRPVPVRVKAPAKTLAPQMRLRVEPSNSFAESRDIQVPVVDDVESLVNAVGSALGANVVEVSIWDDDFEEFAAPENISDVKDGAKVEVTVG